MNNFFAYSVTQEEYVDHLRTGLAFAPHYEPYLKVAVDKMFDVYTFMGGILHNKGGGNFDLLREGDLRTFAPLKDYREKKKPIYITSDGVAFYKVIAVHVGEQKVLEITMKLVIDAVYSEASRVFMVMPFGDTKLNNFYKKNICDLLKEKLGILVYRADDFCDNDVIIDTIYREIEKAEFIISDISDCNKNVFYEIGYASAKNKQLIFILNKDAPSNFFDVSHIRRIEYDLSEPDVFRAKLIDTINTIRQKKGGV